MQHGPRNFTNSPKARTTVRATVPVELQAFEPVLAAHGAAGDGVAIGFGHAGL